MEKGINAIYTNDETKRKFQILARAVFKKYKALQPDKVLYQFSTRKNAIDVLYSAIENNVESADVSEIMRKIQTVIDDSIMSMVEEPKHNESAMIDLSRLNFEALEQYFLKMTNKNAAVQSLKDKIEKQLKRMLERNPMTINFYVRYQEIIDEYNLGKDEVVVKETFRKLIDLINSYTQEEADTKREGLNDEQKAIFDILRQGKTLTKEEKEEVKRLAILLLEDLKRASLRVDLWYEKSVTAAVVFNTVNKVLYEKLPFPTYQNDDIDLKTNIVFSHLKSQYFGAGVSVYGAY